MPEPLVITVILNTNRKADTLACLSSLHAGTYPNLKIILLDNASTDGSVEAVRSAYPEVEIMELQSNLGYAGNNNVGIEAAMARGADWVFVLNEDTILEPECITRLVEAGAADSRIGILGPMVYHHDEPEIIQSAGGVLTTDWRSMHTGQNEKDVGQFTAPRSVDWISGCAILVRRPVIEQVGSLDERFFYYWEETEWCLRAHKAGWSVIQVPAAKLWHKGVQRDYRPGPNVTYYNTRNRFLVFAKHGAPISVWLKATIESIRTLVSWSIRPKWRPMHAHRDAMAQGLFDFLRRRWGPKPS